MKKIILVFLLSVAMSSQTAVCQADPVQVGMECHIYDPIGGYPFPRMPIKLPEVFIDENTLLFDDLWGNFTLQLIQNGVVIYSTAVPAGTATVVLPSTLSGDYELRLVTSTFYFYGYITL